MVLRCSAPLKSVVSDVAMPAASKQGKRKHSEAQDVCYGSQKAIDIDADDQGEKRQFIEDTSPPPLEEVLSTQDLLLQVAFVPLPQDSPLEQDKQTKVESSQPMLPPDQWIPAQVGATSLLYNHHLHSFRCPNEGCDFQRPTGHAVAIHMARCSRASFSHVPDEPHS